MSNNQFYDKHSKVKKKKILAFLLFTIAALFFVGTIAAYYSDLFESTVDTATSTLKIGGSYTYYLNGEVTELENISGLMPGDIIVVKANIENRGEQSAWLREKIDFSLSDLTLMPYLVVYEGEFTQLDFVDPSSLDGYLLDTENGIAVGSNKVIDGANTSAQDETEGNYDFLNATTYSFDITIRFLPIAGNETQGKPLSLIVTTQALQFRNNNASEPNEIAWQTVETA